MHANVASQFRVCRHLPFFTPLHFPHIFPADFSFSVRPPVTFPCRLPHRQLTIRRFLPVSLSLSLAALAFSRYTTLTRKKHSERQGDAVHFFMPEVMHFDPRHTRNKTCDLPVVVCRATVCASSWKRQRPWVCVCLEKINFLGHHFVGTKVCNHQAKCCISQSNIIRLLHGVLNWLKTSLQFIREYELSLKALGFVFFFRREPSLPLASLGPALSFFVVHAILWSSTALAHLWKVGHLETLTKLTWYLQNSRSRFNIFALSVPLHQPLMARLPHAHTCTHTMKRGYASTYRPTFTPIAFKALVTLLW